MKKIKPTVLLAALLSALVLTACGSGRSKSTASAEPAAYMVAETAAAMEPHEAEGMAEWAEEAKMDEAGMNLASQTAPDNGLTSTGKPEAAQTNRKLIRTMDMNVETTDFDNLVNTISSEVSSLGGYIEQSSISGRSMYSGRDSNRSASLTVRVPASDLDNFITQVSEYGNVTNRSENVRDVTLQHSDIESHKKSLTIEQERLWELLEKAESVDTTIALESRLSEIRYQLEAYESKLRTYDNQVDYSTVNLYIEEVKVFTPTDPDSIGTRIQKGFQRNIENISDDFVNLFVWFVSSIPLLLIWAVVIVVIALIGRTGFKIITRIKDKRSDKGSINANESNKPHS